MMKIQKFAAAEGTFLNVKPDEGFKSVTLVAVDETDGITFNTVGIKNIDLLFVASNSGGEEKDITIVAPTNGGYAASDTDLTLSVPTNGIAVARVSTAKYANNDGTIVIKGGSADIKVQAIY